MAVVDKDRKCKIIDFAIPGYSRIVEKEKKIRQKNIKIWEGIYRRYGMLK